MRSGLWFLRWGSIHAIDIVKKPKVSLVSESQYFDGIFDGMFYVA